MIKLLRILKSQMHLIEFKLEFLLLDPVLIFLSFSMFLSLVWKLQLPWVLPHTWRTIKLEIHKSVMLCSLSAQLLCSSLRTWNWNCKLRIQHLFTGHVQDSLLQIKAVFLFISKLQWWKFKFVPFLPTVFLLN